ncbi:hypothetical protein HDU77_001353 [Chytriomyces hyalinus]|nr:hypothetical protein HDU77_001353 [Chytriomyces hyalinus]
MELLNEFDKSQLAAKQTRSLNTSIAEIDAIMAQLAQARDAVTMSDKPADARAAVKPLAAILRRGQSAALDSHKDLHVGVSKFGKSVDKDKRFKSGANALDECWDPRALQSDDKLVVLKHAVIAHLIREGRFELAHLFACESQLDQSDTALSTQFQDMFTIQAAIKSFNLDPAIAWVRTNAAALTASASSLEFSVIRLQFLKLLFGVEGVCQGDRAAAIKFAQVHFEPFKERHMKEISRLMCSSVFSTKIKDSPYKDLTSITAWSDLSHAFTREFCLLLHLPAESPLHTCVSVGVNALPTIIKMSSIMKEQSGLEWSSQGELPVEIPLLDRQRFHSVFACPVSKELGTKENPPMMMVCGHVVCKESLLRLGKGSMSSKFKCPYCPSEGKGEQAIMVHF